MEEVKFSILNYSNTYRGNGTVVKDETSFITRQQFVPETSFPEKLTDYNFLTSDTQTANIKCFRKNVLNNYPLLHFFIWGTVFPDTLYMPQ